MEAENQIHPIELNPSVRDLIRQHLADDVARLALRFRDHGDPERRFVVQQVASRQKAARKLPDWSADDRLHFPASLPVEQSSSQATARYKATLIRGDRLFDLTLGMGVDTFYLSSNFKTVTGFEQQPELAAQTAYNLSCLGAANVSVCQGDAFAMLDGQADWIYADPARRDEYQRKRFSFSDCSPDIISKLPHIFGHTGRVLLKTSPLMDIDLAVKSLSHVQEVHVVGYEKECKEVLYILNKELPEAHMPFIRSVVIDQEGIPRHLMRFSRKSESEIVLHYSDPGEFLYEPHAAFLKSGGFRTIASESGVRKLAQDSHLYTSDTPADNFPGRVFRVKAVCAPVKKSWFPHLKEASANLSIRNFPARVHDFRKKTGLKEGGDDYLFATTLSSGKKVVIVTEKITH